RESRLTPAARAVARAVWRYRARYTIGALCLMAATGFSLAIPWTVKHAIDALARDGAGAALGGDVGGLLGAGAGPPGDPVRRRGDPSRLPVCDHRRRAARRDRPA